MTHQRVYTFEEIRLTAGTTWKVGNVLPSPLSIVTSLDPLHLSSPL